ncbi:hypothetical protein FAM09_10635 [Niastella caeni]|uniref:Uncharacterized protein n=1 Tax=Niastella caeni TaxID=2569763 RepID=A0A4S8HXU1_9BACT|nr:hypothetical protein [Niastella caeni]THU40315.1 hypothetical protein FAM09_10635 [Niastella caeni]
MLKTCLLLAATALSLCAWSQKQSITWGDEFKLRKGSTSVNVVYTDASGVYLEEGHLALKSYYVIGASARQSASLVKLDKNLQEVYRSDFNKELRGKEFETFFAFRDKLLIIATDYNKSDRALEVYAAEVDKSSGELTESFKLMTSLLKEEKKDEISFKLIPNADTSKIVCISTVSGKEKNTYQVQEFDKTLRSTTKPAIITNEFEAKTYQLEDVLYTADRKIILVGRVFEYQEGKKKKDKFLDFANYNIRIYNDKGKQVSEINTNINGKWLTNTKLMMSKGKDLVLASFYSKEKKGATNGLLVQRIDPSTGQVISTAEKEINYSMLTEEGAEEDKDDDKDSDSKAERKEREKLAKIKDEGEGFSKYMRFRNIFYTSDNGLVLLAENYHQYTYTTSSYSPGTNGMPGRWTYYTNYVYECGELMMCKIDASNNIGWLEIIPKAQREVIRTNDGSSAGGLSIRFGGFFESGSRPFYAGFGAIQAKNQINIVFNDNPKNADVLKPGQKVRGIAGFRNSDCFIVTLDEVTGKYQRKLFFSNSEVPTAMPRHGSVIGQEMYIVGKTDRLFGKTKLAVGKIASN